MKQMAAAALKGVRSLGTGKPKRSRAKVGQVGNPLLAVVGDQPIDGCENCPFVGAARHISGHSDGVICCGPAWSSAPWPHGNGPPPLLAVACFDSRPSVDHRSCMVFAQNDPLTVGDQKGTLVPQG
eukprot:CAMPEP_0172898456 /NCGR_PEP_ID=MMETSP1075-20121228/159722_1 /TAXON_ID=2916 /ORGANISM="Ceratium fusus, Strain PA161109" /LENGTH=125 /DNA_ID=CAMNT_0013754237 /DNA_START=306 /DNA_END=684 /DNA_ORIENTATION=-